MENKSYATVSLFQKPVYKVTGYILLWGFIALFSFGQDLFYYSITDTEFNHYHSIIFELLTFYTWAILTLLIIPCLRQLPFDRGNLIKTIIILFFMGILFSLLHKYISMSIYLCITQRRDVTFIGLPSHIHIKAIKGSFDSFIIYFLIVGVYYSIDYYKQYRTHKLRTAQLEGQLAQAHLNALKMQLQPHFLFNTLHAISALMEKDIKAARRMLARLSDLLRQTLDNIGVHEVTLKKEIEFLKSYLEIEQARFSDRLKIHFDIEDSTLDALVPNLILQPLVENAIKHGILPLTKGGDVYITSQKIGAQLKIIIRDNGVGVPSEKKKLFKEGLGLTNTRKRLQELYGDAHSFILNNGEEKGIVVTLVLPFKKAASGSATSRR